MTKFTVLIDNCVEGLTRTMEPAAKEVTVQWGDMELTSEIAGYKRKLPRNPEHKWVQKQIECLPTIARLGQEGRLEFLTYNEIHFEGSQRPGGYPGNLMGDLFSGVNMSKIPPAIERSRIQGMDIREYVQRDVMINFCKFLLGVDERQMLGIPEICKRFPDFERASLENLERFRRLCDGLSIKQYPDAFHLWTGEVNGIDYFLTTDGKFIRAMTESKRIELPCTHISPEELLNDMGVDELDPFPFEADQFYTFFGRPG